METSFTTNFVVLPKHTNYMAPLIFGGKFMAEIDLACACCVTRLLQTSDSECDNAVTHKVNIEFTKPSFVGDIITINCNVTELRHKAIKVSFSAQRTPRTEKKPEPQIVAIGDIIFVSRKGTEYHPHGLFL